VTEQPLRHLHVWRKVVTVLLGVLLLLGGGVLTRAPASAQGGPEWPQLSLAPVASGLASPVVVTHAGDGSGRLFIVEQQGRIRLLSEGALLPTPFLDISERVSSGGERGLLGLAFPRDYATKRYFYVNYTNLSNTTVISRFHLTEDAARADASSEEILLTVAQPFVNHNGGDIAFGPADGYLYIALGDGGSGGDPGNRAQNPAELLGKILRIDVESGVTPYAIPADNPFLGDPAARPEIWALGLRNPWRFSFDRATADMYIADVGQNQREEINFQPAASAGGENYGWRCYEGSLPYNLEGCGPAGQYVFPVTEYQRSGGNCSVTGGYVYRGLPYPRMRGVYFYGDYCSGRVWGLRAVGDPSRWETTELLDTTTSITTFGEDQAGNLYLADYSTGTLYRVTDSVTAARSALVVLGSRPAGNLNFVIGRVVIRDGNGQPVPDATVTATWTAPRRGAQQQNATTNNSGIATFATAGGSGIYNLTVDDISAQGYLFDPASSFLSRNIRVP
jgi:glucose/arabinose dehydrogenase